MTTKNSKEDEGSVMVNSTGKVVKYFAIALAICIIAGVIYGLSMAGAGIMSAFSSADVDFHTDLVCEESDASCLMIAMGKAELEVKTGDELKVEAGENVEITRDGNKLTVKEQKVNWFDGNVAKVTIYVPTDLTFDKVGISGGVGTTHVDGLKAKNLEVSLGVGESSFSNLTVDNARFSCGIGKVSVALLEPAENYEIKLNKGLGDVVFNGTKVDNDVTMGNGVKKIEVSGGIGEIVVQTK